MLKKNHIIIIAIIVSIVLTVLTFSVSTKEFLNKNFLDDSYYYIVIARNIIHGDGVVFNHGVITNGFHPLYLLLVLPIIALTGDNLILPIYLISILNIIINFGIGVILYKIVKKIFNEYLASIAFLLWVANPFIMMTVLIGLETTLNTFLIALTTYYIVNKGGEINFYYLGILLSLVFLSRMDGLFFILSVLLYYAFSVKTSIKNLIKTTIILVVIVSPYLFFNIFYAGTLFPISGMASENLATYTGTPFVILFLYGLKSFFFLIINYFNIYYLLTNIYTAIICSAILTIIFTIDINKNFALWKSKLQTVWFLILYTSISVLYYIFTQKWYKDWYAFSAYILVTIILITFLSTKHKFIITKWFVIIIVMVFTINFYILEKNYSQNFTEVYYDIEEYVKNNIDTKVVVGSFNPGRLSWRLEEYNIVNLDGLVNYKAYNAFKKHNVTPYFNEINLTYILDVKETEIFFNYVNREVVYSKNITFKGAFTSKNTTVQYDISKVKR